MPWKRKSVFSFVQSVPQHQHSGGESSVTLIQRAHQGRVHSRRVHVLAKHLDELIPSGSSVVDVGSGDGLLASVVLARRPDLTWSAVDTLARSKTHVPVRLFDGRHLPFEDKQHDVVCFVDVLHHTLEPMVLLREAVRVARSTLVIKDHLREGFAAGATLRFMDWVGNSSFGVSLPYNYWSTEQWERARRELELRTEVERRTLGLYPGWADWAFGRSLHFIARFAVPSRVRSN